MRLVNISCFFIMFFEAEMDVTRIAALSMQHDLQRMNTISQNLANVTTPGFKKQIAVSAGFDAQLSAARSGDTPSASITIDPSAGSMRPSSNPVDIAIEGDSFFELATPDGVVYTRQGALRVDVKGVLVGSQGMPLQGTGGAINLLNAPFSVAGNGDVLQGGRVAGRVKRVAFDRPALLQPIGNGMYGQGGAQVVDPNSANPVRSGFQEASNVSSPQEMVRMTETVRHFESMQKIVQGYDESLEKAIRKLGDF